MGNFSLHKYYVGSTANDARYKQYEPSIICIHSAFIVFWAVVILWHNMAAPFMENTDLQKKNKDLWPQSCGQNVRELVQFTEGHFNMA
jgi:hypothetical protein